MNIKKSMLFVIVNIIVVMMLIGCGNIGEKGGKEKIEKLDNLKPISEVSKSAYNDLQEAKSRNGKLTYGEIKPYCPDVDTVYDIKVYMTGTYKNIDNEKDMLTEQLAISEVLLGKSIEELDMECFETVYYGLIEKGDYSSFEEFKNDVKINENLEPSYLYYSEQDETKLLSSAIQSNLYDITFFRGKCYEAMYNYRMVHESGITTLTQPKFVCETVKTYYVYSDSDNFEDKWKLADGELSVREGIDFVENYLNNELHSEMELEGCNEEVKLKVESIDVIQINENYYCFRYKIRREIGGVVFPSADDGVHAGSLGIWYDMSDSYQIEKNSVDMYMGSSRRLQFDKLNETSEILTLSDTIAILESNIGLNSEYTVQGIELGYMSSLNYEQTEGEGTVCWVFRCINELDGWITEFYVNAQTGEIKTNSCLP